MQTNKCIAKYLSAMKINFNSERQSNPKNKRTVFFSAFPPSFITFEVTQLENLNKTGGRPYLLPTKTLRYEKTKFYTFATHS